MNIEDNMSTTLASVASESKKIKGDPRNVEFVIKYDKNNFGKGEDTGWAEFYQLVSVVIGVSAYLTRAKWACWVALFFYYTSCIHASSETRV